MARLDMKHGFLRYITKNQVDRDKFDQEIRDKDSPKVCPTSRKNRRAPQAIYLPPSRAGHKPVGQNTETSDGSFTVQSEAEPEVPATPVNGDSDRNSECGHTMADVLFTDVDDKIHTFRVYATDNPEEVARSFCEKMKYPDKYVQPLVNRIIEECSPYFHFVGES